LSLAHEHDGNECQHDADEDSPFEVGSAADLDANRDDHRQRRTDRRHDRHRAHCQRPVEQGDANTAGESGKSAPQQIGGCDGSSPEERKERHQNDQPRQL
jgi:hypothetical protein